MTTTLLSDGKQHFGETLHLHFSCKNLKNMDILSKSDPQIAFKILSTNETYFTEIQYDNLNPQFSKHVSIVYIFEKTQKIEIEVRDIDNVKTNKYEIIGTARTTMSKLVGGWKNPFILDIGNSDGKVTGSVEIYYEKVAETNEIWIFQPKVENIYNNRWFSKPDCFLTISKPFSGLGKDINPEKCKGWVKVLETEVVKSSLNPVFEEIEMTSFLLCRNDYDLPLKVE